MAVAFDRQPVEGGGWLYTWNLTTANPLGDPIRAYAGTDKTVEIEPTAAGGATAALRGTNSYNTGSVPADASYKTLHDGDGAVISVTAAAIEVVAESPLWMRPELTTVGVGADWIVRVLIAPRR